jgi:hypothetical protein
MRYAFNAEIFKALVHPLRIQVPANRACDLVNTQRKSTTVNKEFAIRPRGFSLIELAIFSTTIWSAHVPCLTI